MFHKLDARITKDTHSLFWSAFLKAKQDNQLVFRPNPNYLEKDWALRTVRQWYAEGKWIYQGEHDSEGLRDGRIVAINKDGDFMFIAMYKHGVQHGGFFCVNK